MKYRALLLVATLLTTVSLHGKSNSVSIRVPKGVHELMHVKGDGVQIYTCTETPNGRKWVLTGPRANLLDSTGTVIGTHSAGPTWKLNDGGSVQGQVKGKKPVAGSVDWLLLSAKDGTSSGSLAKVTFIRRTKTHGGVAGATGCQDAGDVGKTSQVPYTATYTFYTPK